MDNNQNPLENAEIVVSNITLREEPFKQYNVRVTPDDDIIRYSIPIKTKDGNLTKAYETYKENKVKLDEYFAEDKNVKMSVAYAEKAIETQAGLRRYRTIRKLEITVGEGVQPEPTEKPKVVEAGTEEEDISISDIPF